jgi:uncharacterized membrane protein
MPGIAKYLCIALLFIGVSCVYDNVEELYGEKKCPPEGTSFDQTIKPIIESNCAVSGCHVTGQQQPTLESYAQIESNAEKIKTRTSNGTMPPLSSGLSLTQAEIDAIACWVDEGAPDN